MKVDMSPKAVGQRLNELNQLWELCTTLARAKVSKPAPQEQKRSRQKSGGK